MSQEVMGDAARAASGYNFQPTEGRQKVLNAYDNLIGVLRERADLHKVHYNPALRETALRFAQRALGDVEQLCRKWEQSDREGKTY